VYLSFFGLGEKPFAITPDPRYLYLGARHTEALAHLVYGITEAGGFIQLTGEVGTGKTTTIRSLLARAPQNAEIALIINPRLSSLEFLQTICEELGLGVPDSTAGNAKELIDLLNRYLLRSYAAGRRVVLIVDEAQNLTPEVLEQVRLLTNLETESQKLLQIILIGQPELRELLDRHELRQLAQRVTARYHLEPLAREDAAAYVRHRLRIAGASTDIFKRAALDELYRLSGGVPRVINVIGDRALLAAYTREERQVSAVVVRRAADEVFGRRLAPRWLRPAIAASVLLLVLGTAAVLLQVGPWRHVARPGGMAQDAAAPGTVPGAADAAAPAPAAAAAPAPAPAPTLAALLLAGGADTSTDAAFARLLGLWNASYKPGPTDGCSQAAKQGFDCVTLRGSLAELRELNRPAILMLSEPGGATAQVVLIGIDDETVQLQIGARSAQVTIAELSRYWFGDYVLLWHPAVPAVTELSLGARGPAVRQLRAQLLQAQGLPAVSSASAVFDADLKQLVEAFQGAHHLPVDGVADIEMQLRLDAAVATPGTPMLRDASTSASATLTAPTPAIVPGQG
jgi:general secretion pathway protein A